MPQAERDTARPPASPMESPAASVFPRGAEWVRADFHLHTLKERGKSRAKLRAEFGGRENDFPKAWVARLVAADIRVAVVTNHNVFDLGEFKCLRRLAWRENILVLPGIELGVQVGSGVHALVVFNPEWIDDQSTGDGINRFLSSVFRAHPDEGDCTKYDLDGCLQELDSFGKDYFVVFAHVQSDNGLLNELNWRALERTIETCGERWHRVLGLEKVKHEDEVRNNWPGQSRIPAFVHGSDPRDSISEIGAGKNGCWLKVSDLSFDSVKFALTDHGQRVRRTVAEKRSGPVIQSVRFEGGVLGGREYGLSDQLTALIGSRGSGKSAVIECVRYALGYEPGVEADARYKNDLVRAMLGNGGAVILTGQNEHDQHVEVRRAVGFDPEVSLERKTTRLRPADVFPNALYFGQKDLGSRHEKFEDEFFARLTGTATTDTRQEEERLVQSVRRAVSEYQVVLRSKDVDAEYAQEAERLRHQLEIYRQKGIDKHLETLTNFDNDRRVIQEFALQWSGFHGQATANASGWQEMVRDWPALTAEALAEPAKRLSALREQVTVLQDQNAELAVRMDGVSAELKAIQESIQNVGRERQEEFRQLLQDADAPGLDLGAYRSMRSRYEQLLKLLRLAADRGVAEEQALASVLSTAEELREFRRLLHQRETAALEQCESVIPASITLTSTFEGAREQFRDFLSGQLKGRSFRKASSELISSHLSNGLAIFQQRDNLQDILGNVADVPKLRTALYENLAEFLTFKVPDRREITFDGTAIGKLSLGQRATAILALLMSLEQYPIMLLDQPEDDLDNETIFREVVGPLLQRKKNCQFVIATHNANIPVLGDAEQIHACRELEHGIHSHESGSLDSPTMSKTIVDIMEGGAEAFLQRQKVLRQWTKSVSDRNC